MQGTLPILELLGYPSLVFYTNSLSRTSPERYRLQRKFFTTLLWCNALQRLKRQGLKLLSSFGCNSTISTPSVDRDNHPTTAWL